ncbi:MAG: hypothetical protein IPO48_01850 [Saprospiraceae bacterium]|nr:hypothetical protein [Saprospiraceae bacterium]
MLCGCIPVGSNIEVIAHIINDTGLTLISKDEILLKGLIEIALIDDNLSPEKSRKEYWNYTQMAVGLFNCRKSLIDEKKRGYLYVAMGGKFLTDKLLDQFKVY